MNIGNINFGETDAKNEIIKQKRISSTDFYDSFSLPRNIDIEKFLNGEKFLIKGLKGSGKTALLRYCENIIEKGGFRSELILFKTNFTEDDRQTLSNSSGFHIVSKGKEQIFIQDFKEAWKWFIFERLASILPIKNHGDNVDKLRKLTGVESGDSINSLYKFFSKIKSGKINVSAEAFGVALDLGLVVDGDEEKKNLNLTDLNKACVKLLQNSGVDTKAYLLFDELELFHEEQVQFDRDRRILRDLISSVSNLNSTFASTSLPIFIIATLRSEVLSSILELGHEINKDVDDFGVQIDWAVGRDSSKHPLVELIKRKISKSTGVPEDQVWERFFPSNIRGEPFWKFMLNSSYYRPRDLVRLLREAQKINPSSEKFNQDHFDRSSTDFSKQTWIEISEELLAVYSAHEVSMLQNLFTGFKTTFFLRDLENRIGKQYSYNSPISTMLQKHPIAKVLDDLYRLGVIGNNFKASNGSYRNRWVFRGNDNLDPTKRMAFHKTLWKHLSLV